MNPILLNTPWSSHERDQARERRHETARRCLLLIIHAAAWLSLGIGLGAVLTH